MNDAKNDTKRPKKYPRLVATKVSEELYARLVADSEIYGRSLGALIRDRLAGGKRLRARTDEAMLRELRRIGGLIKHTRQDIPTIQAALDALAERIES